MAITWELEIAGLHSGQYEVLSDPHRFQGVRCGRRWGKTRVGVAKAVRGACEDPGGYWWVTPTYPHAEEGWSVLNEFADAFPSRSVTREKTERRVRFPGGGWVQIRSADDPNALRSKGLKGVVLDEAALMKPEVWGTLRPALFDHHGWAAFLFTPNGFNWIHDLEQRTLDRPTWRWWHRPTSDNPRMTEAELNDLLEELGPVVYQAEVLAEYVGRSGALFQMDQFRYWWFDEAGNIVLNDRTGQRRVDPNACRTFFTVDPAASKADTASYFVLSAWAVTRESDLLLVDRFRSRVETTEHLSILQEWYKIWAPDFIGVERATFGIALIQMAIRAGLPVKALPAERDKISRARVASARYAVGKVFHPARAQWLSEWERELLTFPDAAHDDQVDTLSYAAVEVAAGPGEVFKGPSPYR